MREDIPVEDSPSAVSALRRVRWLFRDVDGRVMPCACPLSAWGIPPTPLLPAWYRNEYAETPLPADVRSLASTLSTVGELGDFWDLASGPVTAAALRRMVSLVGWSVPDPDTVIVPWTLVEDAVKHWPLRVRTRNCLTRWHRSGAGGDLTVGILLDLRGFGTTSLIDIMCVAEAACRPAPIGHALPSQPEPVTDRAPEGAGGEGSGFFVSLLGMLFAAVSDFQPADSVGDVLRADLGAYLDTLGIASFDDIDLRDITGGYRISQGLVGALAETTGGFDKRDRAILNARLFTKNPAPMKRLGYEFGITRERVRQLAKRIAGDIEASTGRLVAGITTLLSTHLGHVTTPEQVQSTIRDLFDAPDEPAARLARRIINHALSYSPIGDYCFDKPAVELVGRLKQHAEDLMDDVGLVNEDVLWSAPFLSEWTSHRTELEEASGLIRIGAFLARRNTAKARIKAALHDIGRPATRQEIADRCGLNAGRLGSHLSTIPSAARADKDRWGLVEWMEDVYEGIPAEIRKRVEQNGGEVPMHRLLEELPKRFGVKPNSVITYVGTPQFDLRRGLVTIADPSTVSLRPLDKVITGRDEQGNPYWDFVVYARYFEGYSLLGVPPEIAEALGCEPNQNIKVPVSSPAGTNDLSVIWRLSSVTGASLGYLSQPLRMLNAEEDNRVRITMNADRTVSLHLVDNDTDRSPSQQAPLFG